MGKGEEKEIIFYLSISSFAFMIFDRYHGFETGPSRDYLNTEYELRIIIIILFSDFFFIFNFERHGVMMMMMTVIMIMFIDYADDVVSKLNDIPSRSNDVTRRLDDVL